MRKAFRFRGPWSIAIVLTALLALAVAGPAAAKEKTVTKVVEPKSAPRAWLGVQLSDVDEELAESLDVSQGEGALVNSVVDDSPADKAGLEDGDVVIRFDNKRVADAGDLSRAVGDAEPGQTVAVVVVRDGQERELQVELGKTDQRKAIVLGKGEFDEQTLKELQKLHGLKGLEGLEGLEALGDDARVFRWDGSKGDGAQAFGWMSGGRAKAWMGAKLGDLTEQLGDYFGAKDGEGALVQEVVADSPARKAGLEAGDVIVRIDDEEIGDAADVIEMMTEAEPGQTVEVSVLRDRSPRTLRVELGEPPAGDEEKALGLYFDRNLPDKHVKVLRLPRGERDKDRDVIIRRLGPGADGDTEELRQQMKELRKELDELRREMRKLR